MTRVILMLLFAAALVRGEDTIALRVVSSAPILVDRGTRDGVAIGDAIMLRARDGTEYRGAVVEVEERSAVVELVDPDFVPEPGTRGEVTIRSAEPEPDPEPEPEEDPETTVPEHEPWENEDKEFKPDMSLLAKVRPVRPENRGLHVTGRIYTIADINGDSANSFARVGTDLLWENPFSRGGALQFDGEIAYLTDLADSAELDVLIRRFSYAWGGTRFADSRWEIGRFLQHGMPEFGVLDGVEWTRRVRGASRWGLSLGFMPEPVDSFATFQDWQFSAFYEWVSDVREQLMIGAGFQKTFHDGKSDRDLLIGKWRYLPGEGWDFHGTVWVDIYSGSDDLKGAGIEITQARVVLGRRFAGGSGYDIVFRRLRFAETLRNEIPVPPGDNEIAASRYDRLGFSGWWWMTGRSRVHGHVSGYDDEDGSGGAADLGLDLRNIFGRHSRFDLTGFVTTGRFENQVGGRISYGRSGRQGRWDVMYEIANHHLDFPNDRDDLIQHRLRAGGSIDLDAGWDVSLHVQAIFYDEELDWSVGFSFQKRF